MSDSYRVYCFFRRMFSPISEFTAHNNSHALDKKTTKFWSHWIRAEVCLLRYYIVLTQHIAFQNAAKWKIDKNIAVPKKVVFRVGNEDRQFLYLSSNYQSVKPRI